MVLGGLVALVIIGVVAGAYISVFSTNVLVDQEKWGQFGDYFGGLLNPVLSFMAFVAVLYNVNFSVGAELASEDRHREQLREQRLFQLLALMSDSAQSSKIVISKGCNGQTDTFEGRQAQHYALCQLRDILSGKARQISGGYIDLYGDLALEFRRWRKKYWIGIGQYLDSAFLCLEHIGRDGASSDSYKEFAMNALKVQMTESERLALWYAALFTRECSKYIRPMLNAKFIDDQDGSLDDMIKPWREELMASSLTRSVGP
ncbi:hypothetical protein [Pseudomonas juntendi]|uniref:hypothetical protein n=1 Tax=Pseudomonas juntendi TaxID=2666183 RepID=UPI0030195A9A